CLHPWFSHLIGGSELQGRPAVSVRGGCAGFNCGGFALPADGASPDWDTVCACGGPLRAHAIITASGPASSTIPNPQLAPVQFATTHPVRASGPARGSTLGAHEAASFAGASPIEAFNGVRHEDHGTVNNRRIASAARACGASPIEAFNGLRQEETGSANTRRIASAARASAAIAADSSNSSRVRTSTSRLPASASASLGRAPALGAASTPLEDPAVQTFTVLLVPYQHPATRPHRGSYPRSEFVWTPEQFDKLVEQALLYKLVLTVALAREGPVWLSLHNQVSVPGYEPSVLPTSPTALPFILLKSANARKVPGAKIHSMFDDLTYTSFTVKNLLASNIIKPPYPRGEPEFASYPLLRLAPRRGDVSANMMLRSELWASDTPGMLDYMRMQARYEPHPCFPARVMCVVDDAIVPRCRVDCPTESEITQ
ncbi:hypothetical protein K466DRAFT_571200, partial [Polyporus arcularius HHB13444]